MTIGPTIGQAVKNALDEFSKQTWHADPDVLLPSSCFLINIAVHPQYIDTVRALIQSGLNALCTQPQYQAYNLELRQESDISLWLTASEQLDVMGVLDMLVPGSAFVGEEDPYEPVPSTFFSDLESSVDDIVRVLSSGWAISKLSLGEMSVRHDVNYVERYGRDAVVLAHSPQEGLEELLRVLASPSFYPALLDIPKTQSNKDITLVGRQVDIDRFMKAVATLSPSAYPAPEPAQREISKRTLQGLAAQTLSLHPNLFKTVLPQLSPTFRGSVEDDSMQHAERWEEMRQYAGSVVVFKASSDYLGMSKWGKEYLLYPDSELKVGVVGKKIGDWGRGEDDKGYNLCVLLQSGKAWSKCALSLSGAKFSDLLEGESHNRILSTSNMRFSDFRVRFPSLDELEKIRKDVLAGARFDYASIREQPHSAIALIDSQVEMVKSKMPTL